MLIIELSGEEIFNEETSEFISEESFQLELEHSLVSLSKWESKFEKPFLGKEEKTPEEILWYVTAMILNPKFPENVLNRLSKANLNDINTYIEAKHSATTFGFMPEVKTGRKAEVITSELIYYWLVAFQIPWEVQHWHLNRLFSLIRVCNMKNSKPGKMSKGEMAKRNRELNEQRRRQYNTSG